MKALRNTYSNTSGTPRGEFRRFKSPTAAICVLTPRDLAKINVDPKEASFALGVVYWLGFQVKSSSESSELKICSRLGVFIFSKVITRLDVHISDC